MDEGIVADIRNVEQGLPAVNRVIDTILRDAQRFEALVAMEDVGSYAAIAVARLVVERIVRAAAECAGVATQGRSGDELLDELGRGAEVDARTARHCRLVLEMDGMALALEDRNVDGPDDALIEEIEICRQSLRIVRRWFEQSIVPRVVEQRQMGLFKCVSINDVAKLGMSPADLLAEIVALDLRLYGPIPAADQGETDQWIEKWSSYPESGRVILNANREVVAYWSTAVLYDDDFELMKAGELSDGDVTFGRMRDTALPGLYKLYVISICIDDRYRSPHILRSLLSSFAEVLEQHAERDVYFDEICANAYTAKGEALCRSVGMKYLRPHREQGRIYWDRLIPLQCVEFFQARKSLVERYNNRCQLTPQIATLPSTGAAWQYFEINQRVEQVELGLRRLVDRRFGGSLAQVPPDVVGRADRLRRRVASRNPAQQTGETLLDLLAFSDLRDLQDMVTRRDSWDRFKPVFGDRELVTTRFNQLAELRNTLRHSRTLDRITEREGEAALIWFEQSIARGLAEVVQPSS